MDPHTILTLLEATGRGEVSAHQEVLPLVYDELRMVTARALKRGRPGEPIPVTTLAAEALVRLVGDLPVSATNRAQFMAVAARVLREIVVEQASARAARSAVSGSEADARFSQILALDRALDRLAQIDARQARGVELRYFGGMSLEDVALALTQSPDVMTRDWNVARAWLFREMAVPE